MDIVDPTSFSGKLLADKTEGEMNSKINGTRGFLVEKIANQRQIQIQIQAQRKIQQKSG